jgi:CBS domain containing-hemolysin-like protein
MVTDEHGGVDGLVTMEDVIETVLGMEIVDEADAVQDMREMARAKWQDRAKRLGTLPPPQLPRTRSDPPGRG